MDTHQDGWPHKSILEDLAEKLRKIEPSAEPLWADWFAFEGCQNYGIWLLRPDSSDHDDIRASFSLFAARVIAQLGMPPLPVPEPLQHFPDWRLDCDTEAEMARHEGPTLDLSDAVPYGLGVVDRDAVDPSTRAWLELLRRESPAFRSREGRLSIKGKNYASLSGTIANLCEASAVYCIRRARDEISAQLIDCLRPAELSGTGNGTNSSRPTQRWEDIEIRFVSDERVQVFRAGTPAESTNFADMGFEDRRGRGGKPRKSWNLLKVLSESGGIFPERAISGNQAVQKRAQEVRDLLSKHFQIAEDPLLFVEGTGYKLRFKISRSPAVDS